MSSKMSVRVSKDIIEKILNSSLSSNFEKSLLLTRGEERTYKQKINTITDWYRSQRLVMVLGAGASASYGLPDWNTLLQKLLLITIKSDDERPNDLEKAGVIAKTFANIFEPNPLISARYLNDYFKKKRPDSKLAFESAIRDALYVGIKSNEDSDLLKEIRQFCVAAGKSPNLDSIITYNYDDLMEQCLKNIAVDIPFMPIHARGMKHEHHQLPIYHVHGYLPKSGQLTTRNKVVLSEDGYHQQYSDAYGWSNLIQINKFKDYNCLFIGTSFSDPNLRRLLDISKNERGDEEIHHYCFKKRHDKEKIKEKLENLLSDNEDILDEKINAQLGLDDVVEELIKLMEKFEENDALSFGVGILWVDEYDEIPESLKNIRIGV